MLKTFQFLPIVGVNKTQTFCENLIRHFALYARMHKMTMCQPTDNNYSFVSLNFPIVIVCNIQI